MSVKVAKGIYRRGRRLLVCWMQGGKFCRKLLDEKATLTDAQQFRKVKLGEAAAGRAPDTSGQVRYEHLVAGYQATRPKPLKLNAALARAFGGLRALEITTARVRAYEAERLAAGRARASVNAELAALRRMFRLAVEARLLPADAAPVIKTPTPQNARTGFFEVEELTAVLAALPEHLRPVVAFAYHTGWRVRSEVLPLTWQQVDWRAGVVRLEPGTTKNKEGREFPFTALPALKKLLKAQRGSGESPCVFHHDGRPLDYKHVRLAWRAACRAANLAGRLLHDLRRTAVRNLVRAGVAQVVAMSLTGHKTMAVFHRYAIIDPVMQREGVAKLAAAERRSRQKATRVVQLLARRSA